MIRLFLAACIVAAAASSVSAQEDTAARGLALQAKAAAASAAAAAAAALQPGNNLSDLSSPLLGCKNTSVAGFCYNIRSFGGYADAWRGAATYSASGTGVTLDSQQQINNVQITSTGGNSFTISPAFLTPAVSGQASQQTEVYITCTCGVGGIAVNGVLASSNPSTGSVTLANNNVNFLAQTSIVSIYIYTLGQNYKANLNAMDYGAPNITTLTDTTNTAYGSKIVLPDTMLPDANTGTVVAGLKVCLKAVGISEWCGIMSGDGSTDGQTFTAFGTRGYSQYVPTAFQSAAAVAIYWGDFLFRDSDATACSGSARNIQVPFAGTATNVYEGVTNPYEGTILAVNSPFSVTLTGSVGTSVNGGSPGGGKAGKLVVGCNDWPAHLALVNQVLQHENGAEQPYREYFPGYSFMWGAANFNVVQNNVSVTNVIACGEGGPIWPDDTMVFYHGAAACGNTREIKSFPTTHDLVPSATLVHLQQLNAACVAGTGRCTATITFAGNSPLEPGTNNAGFINARESKLLAVFQRDYPALVWTAADRTVGGTQMMMLDPTGYTNGYPNNNIGTSYAASNNLNWWQTDPTKTWMSYVESTDPDVLIIGFADQESINLHFSAILDIMSYTQSAAWKSATGWNPDVGFMPYPYQPTGFFSQQGTAYAAAVQRAFVKACTMTTAAHAGNTMMAAQTGGVAGCPFLIDLNRMQSVVTDGVDPEEAPMRRTLDLPTYEGNPFSTFPWVINTPMPGRSLVVEPKYSSATPTAGGFFSTAGYEADFTIGASANSQAPAMSFTIHATAASTNSATLQVGYIAYALAVGDSLVNGVLPSGTIVTAVNTSGCTASACTATISMSNPATVGPGNTITVTPPGPTQSYPGNVFRLYKDQTGVSAYPSGGGNTGNLAYRYDTVYFQTTGSDCSGSAGGTYLTCTTPEVGSWHQGLQIAIPGGGSSQCPNPTGAANCAILTIGQVSFNSSLNETIPFTNGGNLTNAVTNVQPIVFRTSIPYTVTSRAAENVVNPQSSCSLTAGSNIELAFQVEYRGSRAIMSYCNLVGPGPSMLFNGFIERFDGPFRFAFDSPNHFGGGTSINLPFDHPIVPNFACPPGGSNLCGAGSFGQAFEFDPSYATAEARARISPDIYGFCPSGGYASQYSSPWGGECASHGGMMQDMMVDDPVDALMRAN